MQIKVPQLAEGVNSGTVVTILVKQGDIVQDGQDIMELETSKAVAAVPATGSGQVQKIHVKEGDDVSVGQTLMTLAGGAEGSSVEAEPEEVHEPAATSSPQPAAVAAAAQQAPATAVALPSSAPEMTYQYQSSTGTPPPASPAIRKLAREIGLDLGRVQGTERGGRITLQDIRSHVLKLQYMVYQGQVSTQSGPLSFPEHVDFSKWGDVRTEKMSNLRKKISERMVASWTTVPHVTQYDEVDITDLMALRKKYAPLYEKQKARLTLTPFILKAVANTLREFPEFNASIDEISEAIVYKEYFHIGIAVDTEQGLIVPVIRDVDKKDMKQLSLDLSSLAAKTRERKVSLDELQGGTFTISNQGGIGGAHFTPIINKPEVAILGIGRSVLKPVVRNGKIEARTMLPLGVSYDHRLIDGGRAARFITELGQALSEFDETQVRLTAAAKTGKKPSKKSVAKPAKKTKALKKVKK